MLLALAVFVLAGCSQSAAPREQAEKEDVEKATDEKPPVPATVPDYELTKDEQGVQVGLRVRDIATSTDAISEEGLEAITREQERER